FHYTTLFRSHTHFTFTLMAHCTLGAIRGSVSCSRTLQQGFELATFRLLNDFSTTLPLSPPLFHCECGGSLFDCCQICRAPPRSLWQLFWLGYLLLIDLIEK